MFAAIALCFLLPFFAVSCQGTGGRVATLSGYQLATGEKPVYVLEPEIAREVGFGVPPPVDRRPEWLAIVALGAAAIGFMTSLFRDRGRPVVILAALVGVTSLTALGMTLNTLEDFLGEPLEGIDPRLFDVRFQPGYWFSLALFLGAGLLQTWKWTRPELSQQRRPPDPLKPRESVSEVGAEPPPP
jgi:hypothetical protein